MNADVEAARTILGVNAPTHKAVAILAGSDRCPHGFTGAGSPIAGDYVTQPYRHHVYTTDINAPRRVPGGCYWCLCGNEEHNDLHTLCWIKGE
jgi:hypothetical protein